MNKINRAIAPPIYIPQNIEAHSEKISLSANGVKLYSLDFNQFDVVRVSLVFRAGTKYQSKAFLANSTLSMLSEGTSKYNNKELSDLLDYYGIFYDISIDRDYSIITVCALSKFFGEMMNILRETALYPTFPDKEFKIMKSKRKNVLKVEREKVDFISREEFTKTIYGENHPYGVTYSEDFYDKIDASDLKTFYENHYLNNNLFAVVSGNFGERECAEILELCDMFPSKPFEIRNVSETFTKSKYSYIEKSSALQSAIKVGRVMFDKNHEDFIPMQLLSTVLGGYFGSRLIRNIREEKGYTYSIYSAMLNMEDSGHFVISTEVACQYTQNTIDEIFNEMIKLQTELIDETELNMVRNVIIGEVLRILDGPFGIADVTIENIQNSTDNTSVATMIKRINSITNTELRELAKKYLRPEDMTVVVVGQQ